MLALGFGSTRLGSAWLNMIPLYRFLRLSTQQFDDIHRPRLLYRNFARLREAVTIHQRSRCLKHKADAAVCVSRQRRGFRFMSAAVVAAASARSSRVRADMFSKKTLKMMTVKTLRESHARKKVILWASNSFATLLTRVCWVECSAIAGCRSSHASMSGKNSLHNRPLESF